MINMVMCIEGKWKIGLHNADWKKWLSFVHPHVSCTPPRAHGQLWWIARHLRLWLMEIKLTCKGKNWCQRRKSWLLKGERWFALTTFCTVYLINLLTAWPWTALVFDLSREGLFNQPNHTMAFALPLFFFFFCSNIFFPNGLVYVAFKI